MEDFLQEIYKYANMIFNIKQILLYSHYGYDSCIHQEWDALTPTIVEFCQSTADNDPDLGNFIYSKVGEAVNVAKLFPSNYSEFADILEDLLPYMYKAITYLGKIDVSDEDYQLLSSKSGFLSLIDVNTNYRYTSIIDPMEEAFDHARRLYDSRFIEFRFLGTELGYLPYQIFTLSNQSIDIHIYHSTQKAIDYALSFGVLSWIPDSKLHIHVISDYYELLHAFSDTVNEEHQVGNYIYPDIIHSSPAECTDILRKAYISNMNYYRLLDWKNANSYRNLYNQNKWITEFQPLKNTTNWAVIAGGPSLDEQLNYLKEHQCDMNIICATTVLEKLLSNGITPDCTISNDPQNRTFGHFKNITNSNVPLLLGLNSNWQFGEYYKGPVYLIPTLSSPDVEVIIRSHKQNLIDPGQNITTLATKIALYYNATTINLFGVDLSYPNGQSHASGTMDHQTVSTEGMIPIPSVNGQTVYTTPQFILYINELTELIKQNPHVDFVNFSTSGALFEGTRSFQ